MNITMTKNNWEEKDFLRWENKGRRESIKITKKYSNKNNSWVVKVPKFDQELSESKTIGENVNRKDAIKVAEQYMRTH